MTLENIYYVGQTIAVVVIVASLFAILWQGRQTNRIARAELTLSAWMQSMSLLSSMYDNSEKSEFLRRAMYDPAPLDPGEADRFASVMTTAIATHEAAFILHDRGLVEPEAYERTSNTARLFLRSARARKWWLGARELNYDRRFRDLVDAIAAENAAAEVARKSEPADDSR